MAQLINMIRPLKYVFPRTALNTIYVSYIRPHAEYGAPVLGNMPKCLTEKLEGMQYQAGLLITGLPRSTSYASVLDEMGWQTLEERRTTLRMTLFYKIMRNQSVPTYLTEILGKSIANQNFIPSYNTRGHMQRIDVLHDPGLYGRQKYVQDTFFPLSIKEWNNLDREIAQSENHIEFKNKCKQASCIKPVPYFISNNRASEIMMTRRRANALPLNG